MQTCYLSLHSFQASPITAIEFFYKNYPNLLEERCTQSNGNLITRRFLDWVVLNGRHFKDFMSGILLPELESALISFWIRNSI
jgi:hypothetical protein